MFSNLVEDQEQKKSTHIQNQFWIYTQNNWQVKPQLLQKVTLMGPLNCSLWKEYLHVQLVA